MTGRATRAELQELHKLLIENLLQRMGPDARRKPSYETLSVIGSLLRQEGIQAIGANTRRLKQLQELHRLYVVTLLKHLEEGTASAGVLAEVGSLLRASNVTKDAGPVVPAQVLRKLANVDLPFH